MISSHARTISRYCAIFSFFTILASYFSLVSAEHCPPQVDIYLLNCSISGLTSVPHRVHPETRILDLSRNFLKVIHEDSFVEYHRLTQLILDYNEIYKITDRAMISISITLRYLSLRGNRLSVRSSLNFPIAALAKLRNLRILDLSENPLGVLVPNWLAPLGGTLRVLRLSGISDQVEIKEDAFFGLGNLEEFDFSNNSFQYLPENAFSGIRSEKLRRLNLRGITWQCDCKLLWLREWLREMKFTTFFDEPAITGHCISPTSLGKTPLVNLPLTHFQCPPKLQAMHSSAPHHFGNHKTLLYVTPSPGDSITLTCIFVSQPKMLVQWYKNGALLRPELKRFVQSVSRGSKFSAVLSITSLRSPADNGNYTCKTSNNRGLANGVFSLRIFKQGTDSKYLLDEAQPTNSQYNPQDEVSLNKPPRMLIISFVIICVCVVCGIGLLITLFLFHIQTKRGRIRCQGVDTLASETIENIACSERSPPPSQPPSLQIPIQINNLPYSTPSTLMNSNLDNQAITPPNPRLQANNPHCAQFYKHPDYISFAETESFLNFNKNKPIVRTFAPFVNSEETEEDEENSRGEEERSSNESSNEIDEDCPVHGSLAKEEVHFCPVHSQQLRMNSIPKEESERQWSTLEGYGKYRKMSGNILQRRINSATTDLNCLD
nr:leucine rich repeat containing protein 4 [Hymenolepis microstoma]